MLEAAQDAFFATFRLATNPGGMGGAEAQDVAEKVMRSQQHAMHMMTAMSAAFNEMAKRGFAGPDGVRAYTESMLKGFPTMGSDRPAEESIKRMTEWWRAGGDLFSKTASPFAQHVQESFKTDTFGADGFMGGFTGFMNSPGFGLTREHQAKSAAAFEAWLEYLQRELEYRRLLSQAWTESFASMMETVGRKAASGEAPATARETLDLWVKVADTKFLAVFKTREFSLAQSALVNATMTLKQRSRAVMEQALSASDLPTKTEVEEAHRMIYLLRKELKAIKRQLKTQRGESRDD